MRVCDPLLPVLAREFGSTLPAVAATTTGFAIAYGATQLFFGPIGDRFGQLPVIVVTAAIASVASALSALSGTLDLLVASRIVTGAFAAAAIPLSLVWVGDNVPFEQRQPVMARYLIGQMLGMTAGQIGGGALADWVGWRAAFWVLAATFALASGLLLQSIWRAPGPPRHERHAAMPRQVGFLRQSRRLWSDRWVATVLVTVALEGLLLFGAVALVASYLQQVFGVSPTVAGSVTSLFGLGGIVYALNARRLIGRLRSAGLARSGGLMFALSMALLIIQPVWQIAIAAALMAGLGYYMMHNTLQTQATQMSPQARGIALSWFASVLWLGQGVGVSAAAAVAQRFGFRLVFGTAAVGLLVLGLAFGRVMDARERR